MVVLVYLLMFVSTFSAEKVPVFRSGTLDLSKNVRVCEDEKGIMSVEDIIKEDKNINYYTPSSDSFMLNGHINKYWIKGSFINSSENNEAVMSGWFFGKVPYKDFYVYIIKEGKIKEKITMDQSYSIKGFNIWFMDKYVLFNAKKNEKIDFVIETITKGHNIKTNLYVSDLSYQMNLSKNWSLYKMAMNIAIPTMILMIIGMLIAFRQRYLLYFALYNISNLISVHAVFSLSSISSYMGDVFTDLVGVIIRISVSIFFILFILEFLKDRIKADGFQKISWYVMGSIVTLNVIDFVLPLLGISIFQKMALSYIAFMILLFYYFFFNVVLTSFKYTYNFLFFFACLLGIMSTVLTVIIENLFGVYVISVSPNYMNLYDGFSDLILFIVLMVDRLRILRIEQAVDKHSTNFVLALKSSGKVGDIFSKLLWELKSYIRYNRAHIVVKAGSTSTNFKLLASAPHHSDKESGIIDAVEKSLKLNVKSMNIIDNKIDIKKATSIFVMPLSIEGGEVNGAVIFINELDITYNLNEMDFIKDFSRKAAMMIEHFSKAKVINDRNKAVEIAENMKLFHKTSTHEIKIPLLSLNDAINYFKILYTKKYRDQDKSIMTYVEQMKEAVNSSLEQIEESLAIVGEEPKTEFTLQYLIDELSSLKKLCGFLDIKLEENYNFPEDVKLFGSKKAVKNVINMILKNGIEALEHYTLPKGKKDKRVNIIFYKKNNKLGVNIRDNGPGIKEEYVDKVFNLFTEGKMVSSGQGLMLCKSSIERMGGKISVSTVKGAYTEIDFTFNIIKDIIDKADDRELRERERFNEELEAIDL